MSEQNQTCSIFPNEIITEILTRLPAKSVCRFKCVSKNWESLICNPNFISSYISHNSPSSTSWVIVDGAIRFNSDSKQHATHFNLVENPKICSLSVNPYKLATNPYITEKMEYPSIILSSSNDWFLFSLEIKRNPKKEFEKDPSFYLHLEVENALFVVNPITGKWAPLPKPARPVNKCCSVGIVTKVDLCGVIEKFVVAEYRPIIGTNFAYLLCFDSDSCKWVELKANYMLDEHFWMGEGVFEINGRLYWVDLSCGVITWDEGGRAVCRFIALPSGCRKPFNSPCLDGERDILGSGGCIHFVERFKKGNCLLKFWRLKDYESCSGEWSLVYNVCRADIGSDLLCGLRMLPAMSCFIDPYEVDTVFFSIQNDLFSYNLLARKVETRANLTGPVYALPFVLPSWPTSLAPHIYCALAKEEGNAFFKEQNFAEAVKSYSRSIELSPNAFAYANRALAYLKLNRFCEAEDDCTEALKLDSEYFKAYGRRAKARKEIGNLEGSMEDVEFALKFEPKDEAMKKLRTEIKYLLEKASCK